MSNATDPTRQPGAPVDTSVTGDKQPGTPARDGDGAILRVRTDRHLVLARGRAERYLLVDVVAPTVEPDPARRRPPVNLAFVLDRSGSMGGQDKLTLAKQAVLESIHRLDAEDRFSVTVYDSDIDVVMPSSHADPAARGIARDRLRPVEPRGSTALHGGWVTGCNEIASHPAPEGVNRVLLLTDGLANVGISDPGELARQALELRNRGITTSTFGVGRDFDERLLQAMADNGGGNFYFIGDVAQMRDHITSEVGDTLEIVARDVVLELDVPLSVEVSALSPFRLERHGGLVRVFLGDLVSGQAVQVVLRLRFEAGVIGLGVDAVITLDDRDHALRSGAAAEPVTVSWTYADEAQNDAQDRDVEVDRVVVRVGAEQGKLEALRLNREGRYAEAGQQLASLRASFAPVAGDDFVMREVLTELDADASVYSRSMDELERKARSFRSASLAKARTADGKPVRRSDPDSRS
jgi:Ca-activated chloride channel family protein